MRTLLAILITIAFVSITVTGCKSKPGESSKPAKDSLAQYDDTGDGSQPTERKVVTEFQKVWNEVHGDKAEIDNQWRLVGTEVGGIRPDKKAKTATVNIKFTYVQGKKAQKTKSADFLFHEVAGSWTIDHETAKYPIQ